MKEAMHAEGGGAVLVHCYAGVSRSASCVIAFLMQECGLTFMEAMTYVRKKRPIVFPNFGFQRQLMDFEKALRTKNPNHFSLGGLKKVTPAAVMRPQSSVNPARGSSEKMLTALT
jgi:protein-tyrosine phosphatase